MKTATLSHTDIPIPPKYSLSEDKDFSTVLKHRIDDYFRQNNLSRRGGPVITIKIIFILFLFISSYALMLSNLFSPIGIFIFAVVFGISHVLIVFNIGHDAAHHALYNSRILNKILSYSFNLVGASAYLWNITHNQIHHTYPNVGDYDPDIHQQSPLIRVSPTVPLKPYHRYQAYYATFIYMFYSLFLVFQKDFQDIGILPKKDSILFRNKKHTQNVYLIFFLSKSIYILYTVVIPFFVLRVSVLQFIVGYLAVHFIMSLFLALVLIPVHMVDEATFATVGTDHTIQDSWMLHVAKNTIDYSRKSRLANWFFGGLNTHLIHHIFPGVCHIHYIAMSEIFRQTTREFGMAYHEVTMKEAVLSHYRLLKRMSLA